MSELSKLRIALQKLSEAEDAVLDARSAFHFSTPQYSQLDRQFEVIGDCVEILIDILHKEEVQSLYKILEMRP